MTDRTVVYRLRAEASQFKAQMASVAATTRKTGVEMGTSIKGGASKASSALDDLGINAGTVALAVGTTVVMATAKFEAAMSKVSSATGATADEMGKLRQAALDAGASTAFSATEAADGIEQLAKAGVSTEAILNGGLMGALDLAAAGQLEVGDAAEIAAKAMTQFSLSGDDVPHIADLLASAAGNASGEVSDFGYALSQAGLVADQVGLSIEETTGGLAAFASAGLLGSDAGTSFKAMLGALTPNSTKAKKAMEELGISAYDSQGNFVGLTDFAGQLQTSLSGLTDEQRQATLETIFGSDAVRAASVIYEQGADGIQTWIDKVDDQGAAAEMASERLDNLLGDVEELKGALETAFIEGGGDSQGALRGVTQLATETVNLNTEASKAGGFLGGLRDSAMSAINPLGGLGDEASWLADKISGTEEKTKDLDTTSKALTETTSAAAGGLDAQATSAEGLGTAFEDAEAAAQDFKDLMDSLNAVLSGRGELRDYEAALDDFRDTLKENGKTFDITTAKGRENQAMLDNIASSALAVADEMSQADRRKFLTGAIKDLRTMGQELGLPKSEVRALIELLRTANNADVNPKITASTGEAMTAIERIRAAMANIKDKSVTIRVTQTGAGVTPGFGPVGEVDGGVLDFYAAGGIREQHVAQIAPAGSWRVWAEPETGGEAYIPLAASKRERSIDIWEEVGQRLGVDFMRFAAGGTTDAKKKPRRKPEGAFTEAFAPGFGAWMSAQLSATEGLLGAASEQAGAARDQLKAAEGAEAAAREQKDAAEATLRATEQQRDAFASQVRGNFERDPFGSGFNAAIRSLTKDTEGATGFEDLLRQLEGLGLDGAAYGALAASGDTATARGMLTRGVEGVNTFESAYGGREAALGSLSGYAADQQFAQAIAQQTSQLAAATAAQDQMSASVNTLSGALWAQEGAVSALQSQVGALRDALVNRSDRPINVFDSRTPRETAREIARHERAGV